MEFPQLGFFGNCKATGRSKLVKYSKNAREEVPALPTLSGVPPKGTGKHGISTNRTPTQPGSRWVSPYTLNTGLPRLEQGFSVLAAH